MTTLVKILVTLGSSASIGFGIWHFFVPGAWKWYSYIDDRATESLALYDRLKSHAPALMQVATAIGIIWAGSLIASGMIANAGLATIIPLFAKDPAQAALTWQSIKTVTNGLGNANGEILGGALTLSSSAWQRCEPKACLKL